LGKQRFFSYRANEFELVIMGCFFAQNLTVVEKSKPTNQPKRGAGKPSMFQEKDSNRRPQPYPCG
ncbi:hypothetical protein, partial [Poseidonia sp.]|uniref:hypothetical protein n=1 Tax=Poseidonia sp. TaxID=2666344 RepID=UPI003F6A49AC